uniref:Uncharacterized protein n=1 Tax=Arundo donax TaxID=35708 RepID=A0A0A9EUK1_ARUDO
MFSNSAWCGPVISLISLGAGCCVKAIAAILS